MFSVGKMPELVVVTGAASGIGEALVELLAASGECPRIVAIDKNKVPNLHRVEEVLVNLATTDGLAEAASIISTVKSSTAVVNCAAVQWPNVERRSDWTGLRSILQNNFEPAMVLTSALAEHARDEGLEGCSAVNVSSIHARFAELGNGPYAASKGALEAATVTVAAEFARYGIRVNCVRPGAIDTPMNRSLSQDDIDRISERVPMARFGSPIEVANIIEFLVSSKASYVTGATFTVDGGLSIDLGI